MTKRDIGVLACRILAIYAWINTLHYLPTVLGLADPVFGETVWSDYETYFHLTSAAPFFLLIFAGWFLWKWAGLISSWMLGHTLHDHQFEPEVSPARFEAADLHVIAFSTLGAWFLLESLPLAASYLTQYFYARTLSELRTGHQIFTLSTFIDLSVRLLLGFALLFGSRGMVGALRRLRGMEPSATK